MNEKKSFFKYVVIAAFVITFICSISTNIGLGIQSRYFRNLSEQYRERVIEATTTNNELREQLATSRRIIEDCRRETTELGESVNRNISTAREAIELLRDIREKVVLLESRLSDSNDISNSDDSSTPGNEVDECQKQK